ncbi:hypothetical protein TTHERM_00013640 (macronuclear) [Tetrahymena thermophila SB210]|uniref:Uncharacterized protein n=1 Tax=Tetrahymena thermophila (strain SB210) TaxID=312017 RepID=Q22RM4_TETTS|nr:hypothetical protein TTHERM_00013640 [Tetrahymena thermophila SB210]EAR88098.2 hypothetical protein TTHERM_00013640 [Tetrahymena thermophila SB210]|eukprot:XP_001008343.2 hypothetical protein TTHERM_00013640 [Tetrahymena thermophila SB210]
MEEQKALLNKQIDSLNAEKVDLQKKLTEDNQKFTTEKTNLNNQINSLNNQLTQEKNKVKDLTTQLESEKKNLTTEKGKVESLTKKSQEEKKTLTNQITNLNTELEQQKEKVNHLEKQTEDQKKTLNNQIDNLNNQLLSEKERIANFTKEFLDEKKILIIVQKELEVAKSEKNTLIEKNKQIQKNQQDQYDNLNAELEKVNQEFNDLQTQLEDTKKTLSEIEKENSKLKSQNDNSIEQVELKSSEYKQLEQKCHDTQSQNDKLQQALDRISRECQELNQQVIQQQERIKLITEEKERFQNQLQVVSRGPQSIKEFQTVSYNQQINLSDLFMDKPKIKDFFNYQYEEGMQKKTVSLLSYSKGSSQILSQILKKNITKQKNNENDLFIYNHEVNKKQSSLFLNTKKMGQPITCYKRSENNQSLHFDEKEIQNRLMIQNFLIDLISNISDIQILIVNEVTEQEQNLIMKLKQDFLLSKQINDQKQLIIIHLLTKYDEKQIEQYSEKIQGFFKLTEIYQENNQYFKDQECKNVSHFIVGNEHLQEKEKYFDFPINKIRRIIFEEVFIDGYSLYDRIQEFLNQYYTFYVRISQKETDTQRQMIGQGQEEQFLKQKDQDKSYEFSSNQDIQSNQQIQGNQEIQKHQEIQSNQEIQNNLEIIPDSDQIIKLFIQNENDLILDEELYKFQEVKNYNYKLQKKAISEVNYDLIPSKDELLLTVIIEIPAKVEQVKIELTLNTNKLLIFAQKQIPNSNKFQQITYQLQNHIFQFYKICKKQRFENKDGVYFINLKRMTKYNKKKLVNLCKDFETQYQLKQLYRDS